MANSSADPGTVLLVSSSVRLVDMNQKGVTAYRGGVNRVDTPKAEAPSILDLDGVYNLRDLGGIATTSGLVTRDRVIYRSDGLHRSRVEDRPTVVALGIRHVIDLRTAEEREQEGSFEHADVVTHHVPVLERIRDLMQDHTIEPEMLMRVHYELMLDQFGDAFRIALGILAGAVSDGDPLVFHCTAGKDRTGLLAALILSSCGVSDADIAHDYGRSSTATPHMISWYQRNTNQSPGDKMREMGLNPKLMKSMMSSDPETMLGTLADLRSRHGSVENYIASIGATSSMETVRGHLV